MTPEEINTVVEALAGIARILSTADPVDNTEVYRQLGLRLTYEPGPRVIRTGLAWLTRRTGAETPFFASMWLPSIAARDQSMRFSAFNRSSRIWCIWSNTPASIHRFNLRQQVIPEPNPRSCGRSSQPIPVCSTNRMPCRHRRSGNGRGPGALSGHGGSNGSINAHS
jgi:hypothetical protein